MEEKKRRIVLVVNNDLFADDDVRGRTIAFTSVKKMCVTYDLMHVYEDINNNLRLNKGNYTYDTFTISRIDLK